MLGISIRPYIGLGDALQFSSVPENYFRATGRRLIDTSRPWFFDHNPFVSRLAGDVPEKTIELWNFGPKQYDWPKIRPTHNVYLSNAEIHASVLGVPAVLNRPRLYVYEDFPFEERKDILFHVDGRSHGAMPDHVIAHVLKKYGKCGRLKQIGTGGPSLGIPRIRTESHWELANLVSKASMLIGVDSGPAWVATCFPDVVVKVLRTRPSVDELKNWVPLAFDNIHAHWDDRCRQVFNISDEDVGFTYSYRKL